MNVEKAEELSKQVYRKWRAKLISTSRARTLLSRLPHCATVDTLWCVISYDGVGMNVREFAQA